MKEALAHPGEIIRKLRGTAAEQVEALGSEAATRAAKRPAKSKPKPSRAALAQAECEVQELKCRQADEVQVIKGELAALAQKLKDAELVHVVELKAAEGQLQNQAAQYEKALRAWEGN